jgi:hypothetical protein
MSRTPAPNKYAAMCSRGCHTRIGVGEGYLLWREGAYSVVCADCWADDREGDDNEPEEEDPFAAVGAPVAIPANPCRCFKFTCPKCCPPRAADGGVDVRIRVLEDKLRAAEARSNTLSRQLVDVGRERALAIKAQDDLTASVRALRKQLDDRIAERDAARAELQSSKQDRSLLLMRATKAEADLADMQRWRAPAPVNGEDPDDAAVKRFKLLEID